MAALLRLNATFRGASSLRRVYCLAATRTLVTAESQPQDSTATATKSTASTRQPSSVPKGTVLKGINFLKDGEDPVALDDSEYPDWLWDLLDEKKQKQKTSKPSNRQYHRKKNRDAIKAQNFMKDKKT